MSLIGNNCLVQWGGDADQIERVLWLDRERVHCIAIMDKAWPFVRQLSDMEKAIQDGAALVLQKDHIMAGLQLETALTGTQRAARDRSWALIQELVEDPERRIFDPRHRGRLIKETAERKAVHFTTVYKQLRRYWQRGQTLDALQPDFYKCGTGEHEPGESKLGKPRKYGPNVGLNVTDADSQHFYAAVKKYYKKGKLSFAETYRRLLGEHYITGYVEKDGVEEPVLKPVEERPTFSQFRYFFAEHFVKMAVERERDGELNYQRNLRPVLGDQTKRAFGPGDIYQIDATTADLYLVHSLDTSLVVGRPVVYLVIDCFSQLVAGLHVTFFNPSYNAASMAIWNAYVDKVDFCTEYGITIKPEEWPAKGLPHQICADRGELLSKMTDQLAHRLNLKLVNMPPYRADAKGIVERHFHTINQRVVKWLPGALPDDHEDRGQPDYRKRAALTREEFTKSLLHAVMAYNKSLRKDYMPSREMIRDRVPLTPVKMWEWGQMHCSSTKHVDKAWLRLALLPSDKATITRQGFRFASLYYSAPRYMEEELFSSARTYGNEAVPISYDPRLMDHIYILGKTPEEVQICDLTDACRSFAGWTRGEVDKYWQDRRRQEQVAMNDDLQLHAGSTAQITGVTGPAVKRGKLGGKVDISQIKEATEDERRLEGRETAAQTQKLLSASKVVPLPITPKASKVSARWSKLNATRKGNDE